MKKMISFFLAALLLSGCGASKPDQTTAATAPTEESYTATENTGLPTTTATQPDIREPQLKNQILVDNDRCLVQITDIREDSVWGYTLKVYLENRTQKELMFSLEDASVNGFMCDPFWAVSVNAGMKANEEISFSRSALETCGIREVTEISFELKAYDANDWSAEKLLDEEITLYPLGIEAVRDHPRQPEPEDIVLFDNGQCSMIVTGFRPEDTWGYTVEVYLENKTDDDLMFSVQGASVNGFMCDPFWAVSVDEGKKSYSEIAWQKTQLEENGIQIVEVLTLPVQVYESDDWTAEYLVDQTFEIRP